MSEQNESILLEIDDLHRDDLVEQYKNLSKAYLRVKNENDDYKQQIHNNLLQTKILISTQTDLQSELDSINESHNREIQEHNKKSSNCIDLLKQKISELDEEKSQLEQNLNDVKQRLKSFVQECADMKTILLNKTVSRKSDSFSDNLLIENENLQQMLNETKNCLEQKIAECHKNTSTIEELNERILCLEDNLESKKNEIEEKNLTFENLQETCNEMSIELAMLKTVPENSDRKGNSLFAEVDDQRQKMKSILQGERSHYLEMKKLFNAKEIEIRRLKRENMNIKLEIQSCSNIFKRGEKLANESLTAQIASLKNEKMILERRLATTETRLIDLAKKQNLGWIETLIITANDEQRELKDNQSKAMYENSSLANCLTQNHKDLAKARLECVQFKMMINRIIDCNNIKINENDFLDIGISSELFENLAESKTFDTSTHETSSMFDSGALNESTIQLIGGHELLGHVITKANSNIIESLKVEENKENKENVENLKPEMKIVSEHVNVIQEKEEAKPAKDSENVDKKFINKTLDEFKESKLPRKRNGVTIKRIVIPSKNSQKS